MKSTTWKPCAVVFLMLVTVATLGACERAEVEDTEELAEVTGEDVNTVEAAMAIDDVSIGGALNEEGAIDLASNNNEFAPGDPIYVAMEVGDAVPGAEVRIDWFGPDERQIETASKSVAEGDHYLNFQAPDTTGWTGGEYRAEVWYANERVNEISFEIEAGDGGLGDDDTAATQTEAGVEEEVEVE